jgi:hypothetical protein
MFNIRSSIVLIAAAAFIGAAGMFLKAAEKRETDALAKPVPSERYFEMRTYHAAPGKLDPLKARFRDHTVKLFKKHGIESIGYWTPAPLAEGDTPDNTLVYILAYSSKEACEASWKAFRADPVWIKAKAESEVDGPLVEKVDQLFLNPTDFSAIK